MNEAASLEYQALTSGAGLARLVDRTLVELTGRDRATFLHNFCTNDIRRLTPGSGCEAFVTSVQGKILGHLLVFCGDDSLVLDTVPGQAQALIGHLDRYLIREEVVLADRSGDWGEFLLSGGRSALLLESQIEKPPPAERLCGIRARIAGREVTIERVDVAGPEGFFIRGATADLGPIEQRLVAAGAVACSSEGVETARIEAGWPLYGRDITEKNLPQEVGRDGQAISFVKGCYLGQETVARIDALGHVNRRLCGLRFESPAVPPVGTPLLAEGHPVGEITSSTFSPRLSAAVGLGYVRRGHNEVGVRLESPLGAAEVIGLPL